MIMAVCADEPTENVESRVMIDWDDAEHIDLVKRWIADGSATLPSPHAWGLFMATIRKAQADFDDQARPGDEQVNRAATRQVIESVITAFIDLSQNHPAMRSAAVTGSLLRLAAAFSDLADQNVPELFKPDAKHVGRHRDTIGFSVAKGSAARAMSELMRAGDSKKAASEKVALAFKAGKCPGFRACNATKISNWRDKFNEGPDLPNHGRSAGLLRYEADLPVEAGSSPRQRAEFLIGILRSGGKI